MKYSKGWRYRLEEDEVMQTYVLPPRDISYGPILLTVTGLLELKKGFAWDGASGPVKFFSELLEKIPFAGEWLLKKYIRTIQRGSAAHDALFQLMRLGLLSRDWYGSANQSLRDICIEDGMSVTRAMWVFTAVSTPIGWRSTDPAHDIKVLEAP